MYKYGTGCGYNYGGYQVGYGYGNYQPTACSQQVSGGGNCWLILVLFILLVLLGLCAGFC